jgi:hypothetical protein
MHTVERTADTNMRARTHAANKKSLRDLSCEVGGIYEYVPDGMYDGQTQSFSNEAAMLEALFAFSRYFQVCIGR